MKLSIFTTITNPEKRGDNASAAMQCYSQLADEVVVVDGSHNGLPWDDPPFSYYYHEWSHEFPWNFIGEQFNRGYTESTGDVVIHADIDFLFHEDDYDIIRRAAQSMLDNRYAAMSMWKYQFILPDQYNLKSRLVTMVNKRDFGDRIRFNSGGDACQPSLDNQELKPDNVPEARVILWNYEKILKTEAQIKDDVGRMARAWQRHFGEYRLGGPDDDSAYKEWLTMVKGRFNKPQEHIPLDRHPLVMQNVIKNLKPKNWGYNGFGNLPTNNYINP